MPSSSSDDESTPFQTHFRASSDDDDDDSPSPPPLQHNFFAPPFYNRPPTPLPPSPSLTSLLRPSRPTTPDSSADELHTPSHPVPRASPKVPTYEYYGFVLYLFSSLTFLIYLLWSYLPSPFLHALGIYYYPNRWWSLALPSWLVVGLVYIYVALASYNTGYLTLGMGSVETVVDDAGVVATFEKMGAGRERRGGGANGGWSYNGGADGGKRRDGNWGRERVDVGMWKDVWSVGTDAVMDVPLGGVCEILYGKGREEGEGSDDED